MKIGPPKWKIPPGVVITTEHIEQARQSILGDPSLAFDDTPSMAIDKYITRLLRIVSDPNAETPVHTIPPGRLTESDEHPDVTVRLASGRWMPPTEPVDATSTQWRPALNFMVQAAAVANLSRDPHPFESSGGSLDGMCRICGCAPASTKHGNTTYDYAGFLFALVFDTDGKAIVATALPGQHAAAYKTKHAQAALESYNAERAPKRRTARAAALGRTRLPPRGR